jgi:hypothetical protein
VNTLGNCVKKKRLAHSANPGRHSFVDRGLDVYETPAEAVHALMRVEKLPHWIWEPAAGLGAVVKVLRDAGHAVVASDVRNYGFPLHYRRDFLLEQKMPAGCQPIVTNPPYRSATEFVAHALELAPLVIMLLRLVFLESKRRTPILDNGKLTRVHIFKERLPRMHRHGWAGPKASSSISFAWFVWARDHAGPTVIDRISARDVPDHGAGR